MPVLNPYHRAAVLKQQSMRAMRLPSCDMGFPMSPMVDAFLESTAGHRFAGRNGTSLQLARKLSDYEITALIKWYESRSDAPTVEQMETTAKLLEAMGWTNAMIAKFVKGSIPKGLTVLQRVKADREQK